MIYTICL